MRRKKTEAKDEMGKDERGGEGKDRKEERRASKEE